VACFVAALAGFGFACSSSPECPNDLPASCPSGAPGYAMTVEPVIAERCLECHGNGQLTGHDLSSWQLVHQQSSAVLDQVYGCVMPPADAGQLTATERKELLDWLVCGSPND